MRDAIPVGEQNVLAVPVAENSRPNLDGDGPSTSTGGTGNSASTSGNSSVACSPVSNEGSSFSSGIGSTGVSPSPSLSTVSSYGNGITLSSSDEIFRSGKHAAKSLRRMCDFYSSQQLCDVTLLVSGRRFPAHRLVLSAASDYFAAMFTSGLSEVRQEEISLPHIDADSLEILLHYCYTGELEVKENSVESLLSTAHQLLLCEVVKVCCDFLASQLHPTNCIGIQLFADSQGCHELLEVAQQYTAKHFSEVWSQQEFVQLRLQEVKRLLTSDDLNISSEETIMQAVTAWLEHDQNIRRSHAPDMLSLVRLPLLKPQYISDYIEKNLLFSENIKCQQLLMEAFKHHLKVSLPIDASQEMLQRARPRKSTVGSLYIVGGMNASKAPVDILHYNYRCDTWNLLPVPNNGGGTTIGTSSNNTSTTTRKLQCAGGVVNGKLHIIGGRDCLKTLNTVELWDHTTGTWSMLPNMATHRHGLGVGVIGSVVYSVGGHDGWSYLNTVERWDPGARVWTYVAPMGSPRSSLGVAVLDGKLYAVGGRDGQSCLRTVERYDPHTNRWSPCAPMQRRRGAVGLGVINGHLYAVGGQDAPASSPTVKRLDCVERYDPATDSWSLLTASLPACCDSPSVCQLGDLLVCVGGYNGSAYLTNVQAYNITTGEWTELSPLPTGRAGACTVVTKN